MGWSCAYFYAETLFSPKVASKLLFQISTDHKANMALLRLRKTDSAKERGRFRSALFFQNTTGPIHRNSMPPNCTESKKSENLGKQKGGILPGNDSQITDWNQRYSTAVFQFGLCGAAVFVVGGFGRVFFPFFFSFGRKVADKLEGEIYCDLTPHISNVTNCCLVSLTNQKGVSENSEAEGHGKR